MSIQVHVRRTGPSVRAFDYREMVTSFRTDLAKLEGHLESADYGRLKDAIDRVEHEAQQRHDERTDAYIKTALVGLGEQLARY